MSNENIGVPSGQELSGEAAGEKLLEMAEKRREIMEAIAMWEEMPAVKLAKKLFGNDLTNMKHVIGKSADKNSEFLEAINSHPDLRVYYKLLEKLRNYSPKEKDL